ncbi:MAG: SDR family oxidoreductase [Deltaproteobacteria bacterium]|nr:SDR family oxidoreductase [Deltaproteobacteria bacterium]
MRLKDKIAIITGGGRGIGKAIAMAFSSEGAVIVVAATTLTRLEETVEEIKRQGREAMAIQMDLRDENQVVQMVDRVVKTYGRIDILVNNSGIGGPTVSVVDMKLEDWNEVLNIDLTGSMLCCREVLKHMIPRKSGVIINLAAEGGRAGDGRGGYAMRSPYCCAKMGIIGLTETLSVEVGEYNIRVNAISAAAVRGERMENMVRKRAEATGVPFEKLMGQIVHNYSLKRPAEEYELASCAVFLASDESSAITGQTIVNHCGQHIFH